MFSSIDAAAASLTADGCCLRLLQAHAHAAHRPPASLWLRVSGLTPGAPSLRGAHLEVNGELAELLGVGGSEQHAAGQQQQQQPAAQPRLQNHTVESGVQQQGCSEQGQDQEGQEHIVQEQQLDQGEQEQQEQEQHCHREAALVSADDDVEEEAQASHQLGFRRLYLISTYVIGKERLLLAVAARTGRQLLVTQKKLRLLRWGGPTAA